MITHSIDEGDKNLKRDALTYRPLSDFCTLFFSLPDWKDRLEEQLILQRRIERTKDVDAAIITISAAETASNTALEIDVLLNLVYAYASPEQAFKAMEHIYLAEMYKLQKIILDKGCHADILRLKDWQSTNNNLRFKVLI